MDFAQLPLSLASAIDPVYLQSVFFLSLRLAAVMIMTPLLFAFGIPATVRVAIVIGLASALALGMPGTAMNSEPMDLGGLIEAAAVELSLGATLALAVMCAFAAISMAGRLIDLQIGFGIAQVFDPQTSRQVTILGAAFDRFGVTLFILLNGHHALLRGIAYSLERFPLGKGWPLEASAPWVIKQVAALFALGFSLAAPVVVCLLLLELALGVVARNLPQMNMFVIGIPLKVTVGLAALAVWFGGMGEMMNRIYASIYRTWDGILAAAPGGLR